MNMIYTCFTVFVLSFLSVYSITPFVIKFAHRIKFLDNPGSRKIHKESTPLLGGLAVFIGFLILSLYIILTRIHVFNLAITGYLLGAMIIVIVGIYDDRYGLNPYMKLLGQTISCLIFIFTNDLSQILGPTFITLPVVMIWMVGLMNAMNFLDNMDGIITGMAGILALGFYAFSFISKTSLNLEQANLISLISLVFAGSVFGFLPYNFNPAKIFLGDAGSMFIGYFLSTMGILVGKLAVDTKQSNLYYLFPVLMLSYAIFDISLVSFTRKRDGRKLSQGGKDHSTHRLGTAIGSPKITAMIVYLLNIIIVLVTIIVYKMESDSLLIFSVVIFALFFLFFGKKLDQVPIVIPDNQLKDKEQS